MCDVSQTDGAPLPTIGVVLGEPGEYLSRLEQLVHEQGISLESHVHPERMRVSEGESPEF